MNLKNDVVWSKTGFRLTSPAFTHGNLLPVEFTIEGDGYSPPMVWEGEPTGTLSFLLEMVDVDVPFGRNGFTHWLVYDIPNHVHQFGAGIPAEELAHIGAKVARNGAGQKGYYPPCPVKGPHAYTFRLHALDLAGIISADDGYRSVRKKMNGHVLENTELVGYYKCRQMSDWQALIKNLCLMSGHYS